MAGRNFRGNFRRGTTVEGSLTYNEAHTSPLWLLITAVICGVIFFIFSTVQITGTQLAVFHLLQSGLTITPNMTAQQLLDIQNNHLSQDGLIAASIGWGVQVFMLIAAFPSEHYIHFSLEKGRRFVMYILIGGDIATDILYVLNGRQVFDGWKISGSGLGILIVSALYAIAVTGVTVFCAMECAHRIDKLFGRLRTVTRGAL